MRIKKRASVRSSFLRLPARGLCVSDEHLQSSRNTLPRLRKLPPCHNNGSVPIMEEPAAIRRNPHRNLHIGGPNAGGLADERGDNSNESIACKTGTALAISSLSND
jgi:hypothetical protein